MFEQWLDPLALAIVLGGTILATALRCGPAAFVIAVQAVAGLGSRGFDGDQARAKMARQIKSFSEDGLLRAEPAAFGDASLDKLSHTLVSNRSLEALRDEHAAHRANRMERASTAHGVFDQASELAPVFGLAGTLIALSSGVGASVETGLSVAVGMAVVTTLYGLALANLVFAPLGAAVLRKAEREESERQALVDWLESKIRKQYEGPRVVAGANETGERKAS